MKSPLELEKQLDQQVDAFFRDANRRINIALASGFVLGAAFVTGLWLMST